MNFNPTALLNEKTTDVLRMLAIANEPKSLREVADLHGGMKDTTKAVAEELNIKASTLNKAIRIAYKSDFHKTSAEYSQLEGILATVGRI